MRRWCHPCMQNCRAQMDCRREEEREAQDRTHVCCLQDETAKKAKAGIPSHTTIKAKNPGPELSTPGSPFLAHIGWDRRRCMSRSPCPAHLAPQSLPWVASWLRCAPASFLSRCPGGEGWNPSAPKRPSSWIPIIKASPVLLHGVHLNGSPPSSSVREERNTALNNYQHRSFKEQRGKKFITSLLPLFRTQADTETQAPGYSLPPD